jgi:hypothetical protein
LVAGLVSWLCVAAAPGVGAAGEQATGKSAAGGSPAPKTMAEAMTASRRIAEGVAHIQRLVPRAQVSDVRASCVYQRLTEARVHVQLAREAMTILERDAREVAEKRDAHDPPAVKKERDETRTRALSRLDHLVRRTTQIEHDARLCVDDDMSSVDVTKVEVEIAPVIEGAGPVVSGDLPGPTLLNK